MKGSFADDARPFPLPDAYAGFDPGWRERCIHELFEAQARAHPHVQAVRDAGTVLSYRQLNDAANRAARRLISAIEPSRAPAPVGVLSAQGIGVVVSALAILKAGRAYAPLDRRLPRHELARAIDQLAPCAVLADEASGDLARSLLDGRCPVLAAHSDDGGDASNLCLPCSPLDAACVFFTSGSTGARKGVLDCHRNVLHNVMRYTTTLGFAPGDRMSLIQDPSFSGTLSTLLGALLNGATLSLLDLRLAGLEGLGAWLSSERVTVFHGVPSIFRQIGPSRDRYRHLRLIRLEGDAATAADLRHFERTFHDDCVLVNGLGATESGLVRQYAVRIGSAVPASSVVPVGYPVADVRVEVVDECGRPVAEGEIGEVAIESAYLATGYLGDAELTRQRFQATQRGTRVYRSADLGKMDRFGCLTLLGRSDGQVKLAGELVDLSQIESMLCACEGVSQAIVEPYSDRSGERRLAAYLVAEAQPAPDPGALRLQLEGRVARSMIPSAIVYLGELPLSPDGKVDRRRLPRPERSRPQLAVDYAEPRTPRERQIARIWSNVLEIDDVGVDDSFFDLGGDSLRASRVVSELERLEDTHLGVVDLLEHPTVRSLGAHLDTPAPTAAALAPAARERIAAAGARPWPEHSVAVIGMAGRFPGAASVDELWESLRAGREGVTFFDGESAGREDDATAPVCARGVVPDADRFDAGFFGLTPRQARDLDPQQRLWLECVFHALEDAGVAIRTEGKGIGVFAGARESSYLWHVLGGDREAVERMLREADDDVYQLQLGNDCGLMAGRTSFLLGLNGPSVNVQSACSTSLVAIAMACQALVDGQCDIAVAGGVCVTFPQLRAYRRMRGGIHSHDGHCRAFDATASGTVFGNGVGAIVLRRADEAIACGDRCEAVIRGWAINNDGGAKASFMAPSAQAQAEAIAAAHRHAGVQPTDIDYIEAHGTGTEVGDAIEIEGLKRAFARSPEGDVGCAIGSVKTNLGHLDVAAGVTGLVKVVLALRHGQIPSSLNFAAESAALARSPFRMVDRLREWPRGERPRIAGVSSFGVGGTNCHVVVQEAPSVGEDGESVDSEGEHELLTLSARSRASLRALEDRYRAFLEGEPADSLAAIAATTQEARSQLEWRSAAVGRSPAQLADALAQRRGAAALWRGRARVAAAPTVGFVFTGQGALHPGIARELSDSEAPFRDAIVRCGRLLGDAIDRPLLDLLHDPHAGAASSDHALHAHVALFCVQYALAQLLRSWGVRPALAMGHSLGEIAAACVAGVMTLETALALACERGRLMQALDGDGTMMAVLASREEVAALLAGTAGEATIAAVNAPRHTVISGPAATIEALSSRCRAKRWACTTLDVSHAFHSPLVWGAAQPLERFAATLELREPSLALISGMHGRRVSCEVSKPSYWGEQLRRPVEFSRALRAAHAEGCTVLLEIGPDARLSALVKDNLPADTAVAIPTLRRGVHERVAMLEAVARLYVQGVPIAWSAVRRGRSHRTARLPAYPFERRRFWHEPRTRSVGADRAPEACVRSSADAPLGRRMRLPGSPEIRFAARASATTPIDLDDHRLFGIPVAPGASHFALLAEAAPHLASGRAVAYTGLYLVNPLVFRGDDARDLQLLFAPRGAGWSLELLSAAADTDDWTLHMLGQAARAADEPRPHPARLDVAGFVSTADRIMAGRDFYAHIWANQGGTGTSFRWIDRIWQKGGEAICRLESPLDPSRPVPWRFHPGVIEAACQVLHCCGTFETREDVEVGGVTYVPFSVERLRIAPLGTGETPRWCHARLSHASADEIGGDLAVLSSDGSALVEIERFCLRPIARGRIAGDAAQSAVSAIASSQRREAKPAAGQTLLGSQPTRDDLLRYVQLQCTELLGEDASQVHVERELVQLGLDSLAAVLLANRIENDIGVSLPMARMLRDASISTLVDDIESELSQRGAGRLPA